MKTYRIVFPLLLSVLIMLVSSCVLKREHMYHFTQNDSLYFDIYDTLQLYYLKTNKGIDTLQFKKKQIDENYNEWYVDMSEGSIFNAFFYCEGNLRHNGFEEVLYVSYKKVADGQDPIFNIVMGERYAMPVKDERNYSSAGIYKDIIIIDSLNSFQNNYQKHHFTFESMKWHKYKCVIEYKLSDGTIYKDSMNQLNYQIMR